MSSPPAPLIQLYPTFVSFLEHTVLSAFIIQCPEGIIKALRERHTG